MNRSLESKITLWIVSVGTMTLLLLCYLLWVSDVRVLIVVTLLPLYLIAWLYMALHVRNLLLRHFRSLANMVEGLREGEFSVRLAPTESNSAWNEIYYELNQLASQYQNENVGTVEANILVEKLLSEFDAPVFVFDRNTRLTHCNIIAGRLFDKSPTKLIGLNVPQLNMDELLDEESGTVIEHWFPTKGGRWELRKNVFMQQGKRYTLIFLNDISRALREEERQAWSRLIRVLGHELNNSLASVMSVCETLIRRLGDDKTPQWCQHYERALNLIHERSGSLLKFTDAYARLAKLPKPQSRTIDLLATLNRMANLVEGNFKVINTAAFHINADPEQLEQLLINVMKNAVEASAADATIYIEWFEHPHGVKLHIIDEGTGLPSSGNLFVPFFTTKENGNGIGLFLCRQIAEGHGGTLQLRNRQDAQGCVAELWLPTNSNHV